MNPKRVNLFVTLGISTALSLTIIFLTNLEGWVLVLTVLAIIMGGQAFRYALDHATFFNPQKRKDTISKKEMEREVRGFFRRNPEIAARFLRMDELARKGNYHDAISLGNALKHQKLAPIVEKYIDYKLEKYHRFLN
ncbi:hypothetical protein GF325_17015 [Candidatus Bathyarchaeota archaeon]|nr:hypothetical protein [Candidatus Bathyarchaeota archaeon]